MKVIIRRSLGDISCVLGLFLLAWLCMVCCSFLLSFEVSPLGVSSACGIVVPGLLGWPLGLCSLEFPFFPWNEMTLSGFASKRKK